MSGETLPLQSAPNLNFRGADELGGACEALLSQSLQLNAKICGMRIGGPGL